MALVGGGGAANTAGGNPAGTGTSLNYIGDDPKHCYGYSGQLTVSNSAVTMLEFFTGSQYTVGKLQFTWTTTGDEYTGDDLLLQVFIDDQIVISNLGGSAHDRARAYIELLCPPFARIKVTLKNASSATGHYGTIAYTGRAYA